MHESKTEATDPLDMLAAGEGHEGRLKIFLSYGPGVGKSYAMLDESQRRRKRGQDVVVGWVDSKSRPATEEVLAGLEIVPPKQIGDQQEMDVDAILARRPALALVDDLAHKNLPGSRNERRWQDVEELIASGISVLTTLDVQNLESLNDRVFDLTGVRIEDTVPDQMFARAEEVEMVDLTPRALIHRMERGDIYPGSETRDDELSWITEGKLSALRELALREIAGRVDDDVEEFRKSNRIERPWAAHDRVMICISPTKPSMRLIRRGWRISQRMHADVIAVVVEDHPMGEREQTIVRSDFSLAERLKIPTVTLKGNVAEELIKYARENSVTHMVIGHSERTRMQEIVKGSIISSLARELKTIDILVVASDAETTSN